ncbi:MAG: DUF2079 domain-containing protein [Patescibacteria group bacterium]|jgi:uncharacterized membrane protein
MNSQESPRQQHAIPWIVLGTILVYAVIFCTLSAVKLNLHLYNALDLGIYNQVFWNSVHGNLFGMTIHPQNYFGDHFEPFIFFLLPVYGLFQHPLTLLILQTLALASGAWPLYRIARRSIGVRYAALIAILYLANPFIQNANAFEFHMLPFAVPLILWMIDAYMQKRYRTFLLLMIISLLVREDVSLVVIGMGLLALVERRTKSWSLVPIIAGLVWLGGSLLFISSMNPDGVYKFFSYYTPGSSESSVLQSFASLFPKFISLGNLALLFALLLPFLGIPLRAPRMLIPGILVAGELFLTGFTELILKTHYSVLLLPVLFVATIEGVRSLQERPPAFAKFLPHRNAFLFGMLGMTSLYGILTFSPLPELVHTLLTYPQRAEVAAGLDNALQQTMPADKIASGFSLLPDVSGRSNVYSLHYAYTGTRQYSDQPYVIPQDTNVLLVDLDDFIIYHLQSFNITPYARARDTGAGRIRALITDGGYTPVAVHNNSIVYRQHASSQSITTPLVETSASLPADFTPIHIVVSPELTVVGGKPVETQDAGIYGVRIAWKVDSEIRTSYQFLFRIRDAAKHIQYEKMFPMGNGIFPTTEWRMGTVVTTTHWLSVPNGIAGYTAEIQVIDIKGYMTLDGLRTAVPLITSQREIGPAVPLDIF